MPVFYFNVRAGEHLVRDLAGTSFPDVVAARECAVKLARDALADKVERGEIIDGQVMEICDSAGTVVATVPFREAIRFD
jgi:hypothetical protein